MSTWEEKNAKEEAARAQLDKKIEELRERLHKRLSRAIDSGSVPQHFYRPDHLLVNAVFDSWCWDRQYQASKSEKENFDNIYRFL